MKQMITFAAATLLTSIAFAWPSVGDSAVYLASQATGSSVTTGSLKLTTTAINASADTLTIEATATVNGQAETSTETAPLSSYQQLAQAMPMLLSSCSALGGTAEAVKTPAGIFDTCKLANNDATHTGSVWMANVPFGFVKQITTEKSTGMVEEIVLQSFVNGK